MVGYSADDLMDIVYNLNLNDLKNDYSIKYLKNFSISSSNKIKEFLNKLYFSKNKIYFSDIKKNNEYLLKVTTTSLKYKRQIIIPDELYLLNIHPDTFKIIDAVMMSSTFPLIYSPYKVNDGYFLDGGIKNKINLDLFKNEFGLKLSFRIVKNMNYYPFSIYQNNVVINIPVNIKAFDFNLTKHDLNKLIEAGYKSTNAYLDYFLNNKISRY